MVGPDLRRTVYTAVYLELNAKLQMQAEAMSKKVRFLTKGEVSKVTDTTSPANVNRAWENWCRAADRPYRSRSHRISQSRLTVFALAGLPMTRLRVCERLA